MDIKPFWKIAEGIMLVVLWAEHREVKFKIVYNKCGVFITCRQYYREGETKEFENLECEWPLFYIFMIIDGVFKNLPEQVEEYQSLLKTRIKTDRFGGKYGCRFFVNSECDPR